MHLRDDRGAAAVEFAVVLPLLLMLVFGIIEFGLLIYNKAMITNASREAARAGIVYASDPTTGELARLDKAALEDIVKAYCEAYLITFSSSPQGPLIEVSPNAPETLPRGENLTVTVRYHYDYILLPAFVKTLVGGSTLVADTTMRAE
ncbi:TadE/TadG family type IV pilus assembly protein [Geoalkalibacter halelectricus]|uniref:Pilus assembly protein n=1 Tax=Geoalkalibacter halelectricus TaxID=2847045 RepID=A0ABY5ZM88_9BACT|nr:TadE/TadG family type IV pilus assembly protein [Geoalkalibacter halelectricus]MDO3378430.1 pilus assembly protein [Geoalkalibacter halelectricus]UWZ80250.1 pilus assembly protein [Geoalkalibacter halelectricus]